MPVDTLRPNGVGTTTEFTASTGDNYDCVNESIANDSDYVFKSEGYNVEQQGFAVRENSTTTTYSTFFDQGDYQLYSKELTTRPSDSQSWTITDINSLEVGPRHMGHSEYVDLYTLDDTIAVGTINKITIYIRGKEIFVAKGTFATYVSQVYVEVDYTAPTSTELYFTGSGKLRFIGDNKKLQFMDR